MTEYSFTGQHDQPVCNVPPSSSVYGDVNKPTSPFLFYTPDSFELIVDMIPLIKAGINFDIPESPLERPVRE
jgi:hypothetical protein